MTARRHGAGLAPALIAALATLSAAGDAAADGRGRRSSTGTTIVLGLPGSPAPPLATYYPYTTAPFYPAPRVVYVDPGPVLGPPPGSGAVLPPIPDYTRPPPPAAAAPPAGPPPVNVSDCREFTSSVTVADAVYPAYGIACRQHDGSWRVVEGPTPYPPSAPAR